MAGWTYSIRCAHGARAAFLHPPFSRDPPGLVRSHSDVLAHVLLLARPRPQVAFGLMIRYDKLVQVFVMGIPRAATVFKGVHSCDCVEVCFDIA